MKVLTGFEFGLRWLVLGGTLLAIGVLAVAPQFTRFGDGPAQSLTSQGTSQPQGTVRLLTANLWHDYPRYRDLESRWETLAQAFDSQQVDIACLQEVPWTKKISNRAVWLGKRLGTAFVYGRANGSQNTLGFEEGLAIISRYPLRDPQLIEIQPQASPLEHRALLRATVDTPSGELAIYCVHLTTSPRVRADQMAWLQDFVERDAGDRTAIIAGDFNADQNASGLQNIRRSWEDTYRTVHPTAPGQTFSLSLPIVGEVLSTRYDYIFHIPGATTLATTDSQVLFTGPDRISDHHAVLTTFSLNPTHTHTHAAR